MTGPTGPQGDTGPAGSSVTLDFLRVYGYCENQTSCLASCPEGYTMTGGTAWAYNAATGFIPLATMSWNLTTLAGFGQVYQEQIQVEAFCIRLVP